VQLARGQLVEIVAIAHAQTIPSAGAAPAGAAPAAS
jgi:hypothetical protein